MANKKRLRLQASLRIGCYDGIDCDEVAGRRGSVFVVVFKVFLVVVIIEVFVVFFLFVLEVLVFLVFVLVVIFKEIVVFVFLVFLVLVFFEFIVIIFFVLVVVENGLVEFFFVIDRQQSAVRWLVSKGGEEVFEFVFGGEHGGASVHGRSLGRGVRGRLGGYTIGRSCLHNRMLYQPLVNDQPQPLDEVRSLSESSTPPPASNRHQAAWNLPAAVVAWLVPGLGHILAGHPARGVILMLAIGGMWGAGLLIGGISVIEARNVDRTLRPWYLGQALIAPSIAIEYTHDRFRAPIQGRDPSPTDDAIPFAPAYGRAAEIGTLYTALAGLLNLLAIIDIAYREPRSTEHALPLGAGHPTEAAG